MAEEKKAGKELLTKHGEKIGLAVAALALVAYLVTGVLMAEEDRNVKDVRSQSTRLEGEKSKRHAEETPIPDARPWKTEAVAPWNQVVESANRTPVDNWVAFITTEPKGTGLDKPIERKRLAFAPTINFGDVQVNLDNVTMSWTVKDFSPAEITKIKKENNDPVKLSHFVVERRKGGGAWEVVAEKLDLKTLTWKDTKIDPKTAYEYRVTAYTADPLFMKAPNGEQTGKVMTVGTSAPAQTLGIWKLAFRSPSRPENAEKGGMVQVVIEKFEKALGKKVTTSRIHRDGDKIGWWTEGADPEPVSKHKVFEGGKAYTVDFDTGATLVSVNPKKVTVEIKKCKPKYDASTGNKEGCDTIGEKRTFDVYEIHVKDEEGDKKFLSPNPRETPNGQDQFCEDHGGKKIVAALPGDAPKKPDEPAAAPAPKVDPAAEAAKKKEAEAERLWKEAEKLLAADNKKGAVAIYEKLLSKDFAGTDFVAKGKKAVIEERLATLNK
jgi:hypothetical protein